jgi:hypothetical protein
VYSMGAVRTRPPTIPSYTVSLALAYPACKPHTYTPHVYPTCLPHEPHFMFSQRRRWVQPFTYVAKPKNSCSLRSSAHCSTRSITLQHTIQQAHNLPHVPAHVPAHDLAHDSAHDLAHDPALLHSNWHLFTSRRYASSYPVGHP